MSTHNICFRQEIRKNIATLWWKKSALSRAMDFVCVQGLCLTRTVLF